MKFNPMWHELFEKLGGNAHLAEFMPAKLKDNETVDLLIEIAGFEVADFCATEEDAERLIEIVDMIMLVAYTTGYKAAEKDAEIERELVKP
jgi:hypothetical protein